MAAATHPAATMNQAETFIKWWGQGKGMEVGFELLQLDARIKTLGSVI